MIVPLSFLRKKSLFRSSILLLTVLAGIGCHQTSEETNSSQETETKSSMIPLTEIRLRPEESTMDNPYMQAAAEVQARHRDKLFAVKGVYSVGLTLLPDGRIAISVSTESLDTDGLPKELEGLPVIYKTGGKRPVAQ